jgi:hypothetical protein
MSIPKGYRLQMSKETFEFDIISSSPNFQKYKDYAERRGLVRDVCDSSLDDVICPPVSKYLNVKQKSATWFRLRAAADGTASSVGKYIKGTPNYPTLEQVSQSWFDLLSGKPYEVGHTAAGHMRWGVGYEDPALIHFAVENNLVVAQVGTIHLPLSYILDISEDLDIGTVQARAYLRTLPESSHLLVSPDGVVGYPDSGGEGMLPTELAGMLEIKCISPFHHVEEEDGTLSWVDNMETRQWFSAAQIPYVYVTQICLQAISGLYHFGMTRQSTMWFIRWSPKGFSEFKTTYDNLIRMGCLSAMLYYHLRDRLTLESLPLTYTSEEQELVRLLHTSYMEVLNGMTHRYVEHSRLYPEFDVYRRCTEQHRFVMPGHHKQQVPHEACGKSDSGGA